MADDVEVLYDLLYLLPVGVVAFDGSGAVEAANPLSVQLLNPFVSPLDTANAFKLLAPLVDDLADVVLQSAGEPVVLARHRSTLTSPGQAPITVELSVHCPRPNYYMAILTDVTELVRQEHELRRERDRIRVIVEMVHDYAIYTISRDGLIDSWNASGERLFGLSAEHALGKSLAEIVVIADGSSGSSDQLERDVDDAGSLVEPSGIEGLGEALDGAVFAGWRRIEGWSISAAGNPFFADTMISTLVDETGRPEGFAVISRDSTEVRRREDALRTEADTDPLTSLVNRRGFSARADRLISAIQVNGAPAAVLMVDIDHFKHVNDTYGHDGGDVVLRAVSQSLAQGLRKIDIIGRIGGEEFAALLAGSTLESAMRSAEALRAGVEALEIEVSPGVTCRVTVSVGAACLTDDLATALHCADLGLYAAKQQGRNRVIAG